jgi:hypothetical protein
MQGEGKDVKKVRGRKVIRTRSTEIMISVYSFVKKWSNSGSVISANEIPELVFEATDVPLNTP